jgi:hypothetical protein
LRVIVHSAGIQDRDGAALVLEKIRQRFNWLELVWADGGYNAHQVDEAAANPRRMHLRLVGPLPPPRQGLRSHHRNAVAWIFIAHTPGLFNHSRGAASPTATCLWSGAEAPNPTSP